MWNFRTIFLALLAPSLLAVTPSMAEVKQELGRQDGWTYGETRAGIKDKDHPMPTFGWLTFNEKPMPAKFERRDIIMIGPLGTFQYKLLEEDFRDFGWFKVSDIKSTDAPATSKDTFSDEDTQRGYYFGSFNERRQNTPASWVFVQGAGGDGQWLTWVDPERLSEFALHIITVTPLFFAK